MTPSSSHPRRAGNNNAHPSPFVTAYPKVHGRTPAAVAHALTLLDPLLAHLKEARPGRISEIFEGVAPQEADEVKAAGKGEKKNGGKKKGEKGKRADLV